MSDRNAAAEIREKAAMQREVRKAANMIVRCATSGRWSAQPWTIVCVIQRARELEQWEYIEPLETVLRDIVQQSAYRN